MKTYLSFSLIILLLVNCNPSGKQNPDKNSKSSQDSTFGTEVYHCKPKTNDKDWYRSYFVYGDMHFNEAGNRVIAEEILKALGGQTRHY